VNQTSLTRRLLIGAAGLVVGGMAAFGLASPASAQDDDVETFTGQHDLLTPSQVEFVDDCDGTWVSIVSGTFLETYHWTITAGGEEIWSADVPGGTSPEEAPLVPSDAGEILVDFDGSPDNAWPQAWTWTAPAGEDCEEEEPEPEPPAQTGEILFEFDCEVFTLTITNTTDVEELLTVVPSVGEPVEVTVPAGTEEEPGESEPVSFPSSEGLTVDVQFEGESVIEDGPLEITSEEWEELGCADDGEGGELPTTGNTTMFIAGGAVALLALGGALFLIARRRRVTFTA
jgi:LPXTG-motif cell wall-anchored protein